MEPVLRVRLVNALVLTCVLALYVVYDAGFRFWMAHSDVVPLTAALTHDTAALRRYGDVGLAYDAATSAVGSPPLQLCSVGAAHPRSDAASAVLPMAAVVVESTWLTPDQDGVSNAYAQRLLEGYRYALLTGAPWLLLSGTTAEAALGLQFLRRLPHPSDALFSELAMQRWPPALRATALRLRESMTPYATLGAWIHGAGTRPLTDFPHPALHRHGDGEQSVGRQALAWGTAALQLSLSQLLSAHAVADADAHHVRRTALLLGAEWLRRVDVDPPAAGSGVSAHGSAGGDSAALEEPRITVLATGTLGGGHDGEDDVGDDAGAAHGRDSIGGVARDATSAPWQQPRVRELRGNDSVAVAHVTVPGLFMAADAEAQRRPRQVARALQQLIEQTLVHRHATRGTPGTEDDAGRWWWLGRAYGVTIIAGGWEQQRVKLLYMKALHDAVADSHDGLRRAVQLLHQSRCQFERAPLPPSCQGLRRPQLPPSALPFTAAVPARSRIFVLPPPLEEQESVPPQPEWLHYTGELPTSTNAEASHVAQLLGRVSFFIYLNYRRWMDWFLASLPVGSYQDHFVLVSILLSDLAEHRISWTDMLYLR
ncbi:hypothetical protein NESM_000505900 [Novymonas esmeraldas]|uniref:Uncharacterized protein n=1 Tax=Novymonas esmeraldas TaxID=1808958 RepID=A0AAW0ESV5_9TRYP